MESELIHNVFSVKASHFNELALTIFRYQYGENEVYRRFTDALHIKPEKVKQINQIPFLPISFFKSHHIKTTDFVPEQVFKSSGTTGSIHSRHFVKSQEIYTQSFMTCFEKFYGKISDWCIVGLLPSYLERQDSSLVNMTDALIKASKHPNSGFYLYDHRALKKLLEEQEKKKEKTLLIGVTFALLDFAEAFPMVLNNTVVMETGGMKGRKEELTRQEVHELLKQQLSLTTVHSEYGMTELLSQAYSSGSGIFHSAPWMKILMRAEDDPLEIKHAIDQPVTGVINVIDLANIYSCAFIATDDRGRAYPDGSFEVLGRMDTSDLRGCSLLAV